jgi:hypothetical protein
VSCQIIDDKLLALCFVVGLELERGYPLNLSIFLSGEKATNKDSFSSGERTGRNSNWKSSETFFSGEL